MKLLSKPFRDALHEACSVAKSGNNLPVLSHVLLLSHSETTLRIRASSIDEDCTVMIDCEGKLDPVCVPSSRLQHLLAFAGEHVEIQNVGTSVKILSNGEAVLSCLPVQEFPQLPEETFVALGMNLEDLASAIESVSWACYEGKDSSKYAYESVHVRGSAKRLYCEATTGTEGSKCVKSSISCDCDFLVPSYAVPRFTAMLTKPGAVLSVSENRLQVKHDHGVYFCQRSNEKYPNTEAFYSAPTTVFGKLEVEPLLQCARTCLALAPENDTFPQATLELSSTGITVRYDGAGVNSFYTELKGKFQPAQWRVNIKSLSNCLTGIKQDVVDVRYNGKEGGPVTFDAGETVALMSQIAKY